MADSANKRKMRDERRLLVDQAKTTNINCLPPEIVEEILALLPIESIHRFRSVSKSCSSLLASAEFNKLRRKSTPPPEMINVVPKFLYHASSSPSRFVLLSYYPDAGKEFVETKESYPIHKFERKNLNHGPFVGSCNGLVCLEHKSVVNDRSKPEMVVWNPFTGSCRKLPDPPKSWTIDWRYAHGFGHDSASDDYKVFIARCPDPGNDGVRVDIFSLKAGSWKEVENPARELRHLTGGKSVGLFLNGALHWESIKTDGSTKIMAFDLAKEKFYDVSLPQLSNHHQLSPPNYGYNSMGVVGEYLCVCFLATDERQRPTDIDLWVMKEYCNEASWVHFVSYGPHHGTGDVITYVPNSIPRSAKDGGYLMLQHCTGRFDVLKWINNNPDEGSDEAEEQYSKKIKFYWRHIDNMTATPYTEALTSPFASTGIDQGFA
ncbi:hypothetical protein Tsubulata_025954 [Turnera subulata]|uniref:F-box domain-containing protein n=1 Tax=Turnera subulata TaxID=218843 RepID=A0A9Q0JEQ3_9ROSI|nr:hypothetical protein Tsubulata_025954 [Turnera subulata]